MEKKVFFKDTEIRSDSSDETSFNRNTITPDKTGLNRVIINLVSSRGKKIANWQQEIHHNKKLGLRLLYAVFMFSLTIIAEVILLAFLIVYFILGASTITLKLIFKKKNKKKK